MTIQDAVKDFLATAPAMFVKPEKKQTEKKGKVPVNRYGLRTTSKMAVVDDIIASFVDAGRLDAITPENLAKLSGIEKSRCGSHLSWHNRVRVFDPVKGDFIQISKIKKTAPAIGAIAPVQPVGNTSHVKRV